MEGAELSVVEDIFGVETDVLLGGLKEVGDLQPGEPDGLAFDPEVEPAATGYAYRARGGPRSRVLADCLIGAHATAGGMMSVTRDRSYGKYCKPAIEDPTEKADPGSGDALPERDAGGNDEGRKERR